MSKMPFSDLPLWLADELAAALAAEGQGDGNAQKLREALALVNAYPNIRQHIGTEIHDKVLAALAAAPSLHKEGLPASFRERVRKWTVACFGEAIADDKVERNHRFLEESLELVQVLGCTRSEAHQLVDYVYGRPQGNADQECGGVLVTLAALCNANGIEMELCGEVELSRVWEKIEKIRAKQAAKPKHSPLSESAALHKEGAGGWPQMANLIALLKHTIGSCVDEESHEKIRVKLWEAVEMTYAILNAQHASPAGRSDNEK